MSDWKRPLRILDLCTGTGCIPLLLASLLPSHSAEFYGLDVNPRAISLARRNKKYNQAKIRNSVSFYNLDMFFTQALLDWTMYVTHGQGWDLITCNPPYVTLKEWAKTEPHVRQWESRKALVPKHDQGGFLRDPHAMTFYYRIIELSRSKMKNQSCFLNYGVAQEVSFKHDGMVRLAIEVGQYHQAVRFRDALQQNKKAFSDIRIRKDGSGRCRSVFIYS